MDILERIKSAYLSDTSVFSCLSAAQIHGASCAEDPEIRCWLARALAIDYDSREACALLCDLARDPDTLVRVEAVDSLANFQNPYAYNCLCGCATDRDELVRAYAAYGIAVVGGTGNRDDSRRTLRRMLMEENSDRARVSILEGLYILGERDRLPELLGLFDAEDYRLRCAMLQALCEIAAPENSQVLSDFLKKLDASREPPAVLDSAQQLLRILTGIQ